MSHAHLRSNSCKCPRMTPTCISNVCSRSLRTSSLINFCAFARARAMLPCCNRVAMSLREICAWESIRSCSCPSRWAVSRNWAYSDPMNDPHLADECTRHTLTRPGSHVVAVMLGVSAI